MLSQDEATVTTRASTSKVMQGLSTLPLFTPHYLEDSFSLPLFQLPSVEQSTQHPTIQQRAYILQAQFFGNSSLPIVKSLQFHY